MELKENVFYKFTFQDGEKVKGIRGFFLNQDENFISFVSNTNIKFMVGKRFLISIKEITEEAQQ